MKCTDFSMNLVLENVMKIENFQNFCCMQSFHEVQTVFLYCDGNEFFAHFHRTDYMKLFFVCSYECNSIKLETAFKQAPGLKKNISQGKERESLIMFSFKGEIHLSSKEYACMAPVLGGSKVGHYCLSIEILNILYDRHGPNPGFWCLMSFEHLNSDT